MSASLNPSDHPDRAPAPQPHPRAPRQGDASPGVDASASWRDQQEGVVDRRSGLDRRDFQPRSATGLERRRGPGRRLTDFLKAAEEGEMNQEQFLFLMAIEAFKRANGRTFPAWSDVLEVIRLLGYRKTQPAALKLNAEDWTEPADAPANVRTRENARDPAVREGREPTAPGGVNRRASVSAEDEQVQRDLREAQRHVQRERRRGRDAA